MTARDGTSWHADGALIDRYLLGGLDIGLSASLEVHLLKCEVCRDALTTRVQPRVARRVDRAYAGVLEAVQVPSVPWTVRVLRRLGMSESTAVIVAAARSMSTAWSAWRSVGVSLRSSRMELRMASTSTGFMAERLLAWVRVA